jgi:3-deoxy-manno-octulosonate cytidylyltransferase (CMP-KDO synthetase)
MSARAGQRVAIIPARLASTRFPEKMLADVGGAPLIQRVREAALRCAALDRVIVAADSERIAEALAPHEAEVVLTREDHPNGTSRLAEAASALELPDDAVVVNLQGDEPGVEPAVIEAAIHALERSEAPMATVGSPFAEGENPASPSIVKVVRDARGLALYFSRALIPHHRDESEPAAAAPLKHVGLYVHRRDFLRTYADLPETPLEQTEKLEQLRALEHGYSIAVAVATARHRGIDTPEDLAAYLARR